MPKKMDFPSLVESGENPNGTRTEGAFGVSRGGLGEDYYVQHNWGKNIAGPRWGEAENLVWSDSYGGEENKGAKLKPGL